MQVMRMSGAELDKHQTKDTTSHDQLKLGKGRGSLTCLPPQHLHLRVCKQALGKYVDTHTQYTPAFEGTNSIIKPNQLSPIV